MTSRGACPWSVLACLGAATILAAAAPTASAASAAFDVDDVDISGSRADLSGTLVWSHSKTWPGTSAKLTGRVSAGGRCARVEVDWLNAGTGTLDSISRSTCDGGQRLSLRFRHPSLECARIRLFVADDQTGPTKLVCAGGL